MAAEGLAPLRAGGEALFELSFAVPPQDGHSGAGIGSTATDASGFLFQPELAVNAVKGLTDRPSSVLEVDIGPGKP
jgi:hypothetical protein